MTHEIAVWLFAQQVGMLSLVAGRLTFQYGVDWLKQPHTLAISQSLPLQVEPFDDHQCRAFFSGLLPEGHLRRLIAQQYNVSNQNDFALLKAIGGECAGAITFVAVAEQPPFAGDHAGIEWLDETQLIALLDELRHAPCWPVEMAFVCPLRGLRTNCRWCLMGNALACPKAVSPAPIS